MSNKGEFAARLEPALAGIHCDDLFGHSDPRFPKMAVRARCGQEKRSNKLMVEFLNNLRFPAPWDRIIPAAILMTFAGLIWWDRTLAIRKGEWLFGMYPLRQKINPLSFKFFQRLWEGLALIAAVFAIAALIGV
jgi:hypothetical protein